MKVGETLAGRYELRARIGGGGLGEVFNGFDVRAGREVTVKVFDPGRCAPAKLLQYQGTVATAMGVSHAGFVLPRVQISVTTSPPFVVGEPLVGGDLDALRQAGPVPWRRGLEVVHACAEILAAVAAVTDEAHRALKPGNVWICPDGQVQILDYGIAEVAVLPVAPRSDGVAVEYRAPEQIAGEPGDARSDVFSLGVLLFELVTGVHPFAAATPAEAAARATSTALPDASKAASGLALPAAITALLPRMLAHDPDDRIADADALARQLALLKRTLAAPEKPAPPPEPAAEASTTMLRLPVMRRPRPAPAPAATPTPAAPPAEPELDGPPLLSVAPDTSGALWSGVESSAPTATPTSRAAKTEAATEAPTQRATSRSEAPRAASTDAPVKRGASRSEASRGAAGKLPASQPAPVRAVKRPSRPQLADETDERTVQLSAMPARDQPQAEATERMPVAPEQYAAAGESTEALPILPARGASPQSDGDERTEILPALPRRAAESTAPGEGTMILRDVSGSATGQRADEATMMLGASMPALVRPAPRTAPLLIAINAILGAIILAGVVWLVWMR